MICKKMGRNICLVVTFLSVVMLFYVFSLFHIHSSIMGKSSADLLKERLKKEQMQKEP